MPRSCTICTHDEVHAINVALVHRDAYRHIASRYEVSTGALQRHAREHLPELLVKASEAVEVAKAGDLLGEVRSLQARTLAILEATEETEDYRTALAAIREARGNLELLGRVTRELESTPTINLYLNPQWLELRAVIVGALESHPEARGDVLRALESEGNGRP